MAGRGRTRGGEEGTTSWMHDRCPVEHCGIGWLAGDVHRMICHASKASKPCRKEYLGEDAACEGCARHNAPVPLGYVPLWRHDMKPVFVVIHEHHFELVESIKLHTYVAWERAPGKGESVQIRVVERTREFYTVREDRKRPQVMTHFLPKLWKMPDMLEACIRELGTSDSPVSPDAREDKRSTVEKLADVNERFANENRAIIRSEFTVKPRDPEPLGDILPPIANGKPHKR